VKSTLAMKKSADDWFAEYGESHQHHTNELIHWVCVPVIFFCVLGLIWSLPVPEEWSERSPWFNWGLVAIALVTLFYVWLSPALSAGMLFFMSMCYTGIAVLENFAPWPMRWICLGLFVLAWIGQFIGHKIEGKKPSFLKDVIFLLIGPAWLMSFLYKKIGQKY
jgi:uncharacterized membrane protein YGL010W